MTMREEVILRLHTADDAILERVRQTLEEAEVKTQDIRVKRTPEEIAAFATTIDNFSRIEHGEDVTQLLKDLTRRSARRKTEFDL